MSNFLWALFGVIAGGIITFVASYLFYVRAGRELRDEASRLHAQGNAIMGALLNPDARRTPRYDADNRLVGVIVEATGTASATSSAMGISEPKE